MWAKGWKITHAYCNAEQGRGVSAKTGCVQLLTALWTGLCASVGEYGGSHFFRLWMRAERKRRSTSVLSLELQRLRQFRLHFV
jgi:hypothetical protein